jgi:hypothetical protein
MIWLLTLNGMYQAFGKWTLAPLFTTNQGGESHGT